MPFRVLLPRIWKYIRRIRQEHFAFFFFLLLAAAAWLGQALNETYVASIEYPVKYTNLPPNRMLSQPPLERLTLQVQADGYTIISSRLKYKRPLSYNINAFALYSLTLDSTSVYTLTRYATNRLSAELNLSNRDIKILDIDPDTLIFNFSRVKKKRLPIVPQLADNPNLFEKQYMLSGLPYASPDCVEVTGPSFIIDTLQYIPTEPLRLSRLNDTVVKKAVLVEYNRVSYPLSRVKVTVPVDEFTESEYLIPVQQRNVPDTVLLKTFPKEVKINYLVTLSHFDNVQPEQFKVWVDYNSIQSNGNSLLPVNMDPVSNTIQKVRIAPRSVEYLIEITHAKDRNNGGNR